MQYYNTLMKITIPKVLIINNDEQKIITTTWQDIFDYIKSEHFHSDIKCCSNSESLYDHLINAANICYAEGKRIGYSEHLCCKAYLTGLLHDIGKTSYILKGSALMGGAMIENFWSSEIEDKLGITASDWGDISTCVDVHMSGYFPFKNSIDHKFAWNILPLSVKQMLVPLRKGELLSKVPHPDAPKEDTLDILKASEQDFLDSLYTDMSIPSYLSSTNKNKGVLIQVNGRSSSGKTTFVRYLKSVFGSACIHINRDTLLVNYYNKINGLPIITTEDLEPNSYQIAYQYYTQDKKCGQDINNIMLNAIIMGLQDGKIVIIDTVMTIFDKAVIHIIPKIALNAYKINFWIHRNTEITVSETENRLGIPFNTQLKIHGNINTFEPICSENMNWANMISCTENEIIDPFPFQAHLSLTVGWTKIKDNIIKHLCSVIMDMFIWNQSISRNVETTVLCQI